MERLHITIRDNIDALEYALVRDSRILCAHVCSFPRLMWNCNCHLDRSVYRVRPCYIHTEMDARFAERYGDGTHIHFRGATVQWSHGQGTRPSIDTAHLTRAALALLENQPRARVLDFCAGSGLTGIAINTHRPSDEVDFCDNDVHERRCLTTNLRLSNLLATDRGIYAGISACPKQYDLIVMNPPYIPAGEALPDSPEFRSGALFGDALKPLLPTLRSRTTRLLINMSSASACYREVCSGAYGDYEEVYAVSVPLRIPHLFSGAGTRVLEELKVGGGIWATPGAYHPYEHRVVGVLLSS